MTFALLLTYVAILIVLASLRVVPIKSPIVQRLRALFPSWRFFDDIGEVPTLWLRVDTGPNPDAGDTEPHWSPWQPCLRHPKRSWTTPLWNPDGNLRLAYDSLLMHLLTEIDERPEVLSRTVSYQLTERLVAFHLVAHEPHARPNAIVRYQFKVTSSDAGAEAITGDDVIVSPILMHTLPR